MSDEKTEFLERFKAAEAEALTRLEERKPLYAVMEAMNRFPTRVVEAMRYYDHDHRDYRWRIKPGYRSISFVRDSAALVSPLFHEGPATLCCGFSFQPGTGQVFVFPVHISGDGASVKVRFFAPNLPPVDATEVVSFEVNTNAEDWRKQVEDQYLDIFARLHVVVNKIGANDTDRPELRPDSLYENGIR